MSEALHQGWRNMYSGERAHSRALEAELEQARAEIERLTAVLEEISKAVGDPSAYVIARDALIAQAGAHNAQHTQVFSALERAGYTVTPVKETDDIATVVAQLREKHARKS